VKCACPGAQGLAQSGAEFTDLTGPMLAMTNEGVIVERLKGSSSLMGQGPSTGSGSVPTQEGAEASGPVPFDALEASFSSSVDNSAARDGDAGGFFDIGRLVERFEEEQTSRMKALLDISRHMNSTLDEEELLPFMMDRVVELMHADHGHLVLLKQNIEDLAERTPEFVTWDVKVSLSRSGDPENTNPPSATLIRRILETRQPMRLDDALSDAQIKDSKSAHTLGLRSVMAVPLISRDRLLGVLSVENRGKFAQFNEEQLDFLQIFGHQAAVAIENARLYRSLRDAQAQLSQKQRNLRVEVEESQTALKSERQRLETLESEVRHLDKMAALGMMVSGIAHELNNPLTGALGFAQLLGMGSNLTDRQRQMLHNITSEMTRCAEITRNLLRFSRKSKFQRTPTDLNRLVSEAVDLRRYQMQVNNVQMSEHYDESVGVGLVDHFQLKGVVLNILNNAFDAIQEHRGHGHIRVQTRRTDDGQMSIEVTDDGGGIKEPEKVFDPFYTTKEVGKGTGLGMSVAYGVVRSHGGTISASNTESGARISILLPVDPPEQVVAEVRAPQPSVDGGLKGSRILVVDDEAVIRELCQALLEGEGCVVELAADGSAAQARLKQQQYDLIITDIRMPGEMSGVDLYRWLKAEKPESCKRVIFITGDLLTQDLREALGEVGRRLLTKPFEVTTLIDIVRTTLAA